MSDLARRLIRNTLFNFLGRFVSRGVNFFLVPYILFCIGDREFALFSLLNVCFYYASLTDLGTGSSILRFFASDIARGDTTMLGKRVLGQVIFCFLLTLLIAGCVELFGGQILIPFHLPADDVLRMRYLAVAFLVAMGIGTISHVFHSVLLAHQRMDITNAISMLLVIPNIAGTVLFLRAGFGLEGLVIVFFMAQILSVFLCLLAVEQVCPQLAWARHLPDPREFAHTVRLGMQMQWMRVVATMQKTWDQILLAPMVGLSAVTTYALASKPVLLAQEAGQLIVSATVPVVAHLDTKDDRHRMQKLLRVSQRYMNVYVAVAIAGFLLFSGPFVRLWLGSSFPQVAMIMKIMAFGYLLSLLTAPAVNELTGKGHLGPLPLILTAQTLLQIALSWWAVKTFGVVGPSLGLGLAVAYGTAHFLIVFYRARRKQEIPIARAVREEALASRG